MQNAGNVCSWTSTVTHVRNLRTPEEVSGKQTTSITENDIISLLFVLDFHFSHLRYWRQKHGGRFQFQHVTKWPVDVQSKPPLAAQLESRMLEKIEQWSWIAWIGRRSGSRWRPGEWILAPMIVDNVMMYIYIWYFNEYHSFEIECQVCNVRSQGKS